MATERTKGAKGAARTELVAVRFDPKTKYLMELAARVQRRSIANYVERAVEESLNSTVLHVDADGKELSVAAVNERTPLWDVDEADRFVILASNFPNLLTHDEQQLWKLAQEVWAILNPVSDTDGPMKGFRVNLEDTELLRQHWQLFKDAVEGQVVATAVAEVIKGNRREASVSGAAHIMRGIKAAQEMQQPTPAKKTRKPS